METPESSQFEATLNLVREANAGDREALERLFARYLPRVRRIVGFRLGRGVHAPDLEDVVQDALLKAFQSLNRFDPESPGTFYNWLARFVERQIVDHYRAVKAKKRGGGAVRRFGDFPVEALHSSIFSGNEPTSSQVYRAREMEERIDNALHEMGEQDREVIVLRQLCEMSYAEVAKTLGFATEEAARKALSRALGRLKKMVMN